MTINWTDIILAVIAALSSCGWIVNRHKNKLDLAKMYVDEFRANIAEPLRLEVNELRNEVDMLRNAIQKIGDCPYNDDCPVRNELRREKTV